MKQILFSVLILFFIACDSNPKVVTADGSNSKGEGANMSQMDTAHTDVNASDVHLVSAFEILHTDRYTYLHVTERNRKFWVATSKMDAQKGKSYMYRGGLLKVNFESQEFKRNFDTIYLVSQVIDANQHSASTVSQPAQTDVNLDEINTKKIPEVKGAIKLKDLINNKTKYKNQIVTVSGVVVKVNNGIMGKNWVHLKDKTGKELTISTNALVNIEEVVSFKGKISLDKDLGAGYVYDILMEEATVVK
jgi:hypothetical protein